MSANTGAGKRQSRRDSLGLCPPSPRFGFHPFSYKFDPILPPKKSPWQTVFFFSFWVFRELGCLLGLPLFPNMKQEGRGQRGSNFARQVFSVMIHHPALGGPQTGRGEKATITVINGEEGLPGNSVMRRPSCCWGEWESRGEWVKAREEKLKQREMEMPKGCSFTFCPSDCYSVPVCVFSPHSSMEESTTHTLTDCKLLLRMKQHICQKVHLPPRIPNLAKDPPLW